MTSIWSALLLAHWLIAIPIVVLILRRPREPIEMLAWIMVVVLFPLLGSGAYGLLGSNRIRRKSSRRRKRVVQLRDRLRALGEDFTREADLAGGQPTRQLAPDHAILARIARRGGQMPATGGNRVDIYDEADVTYLALETALRAAERHIHLEYYIWQADVTGEHFRDLLIERAKAGVKIRLLLDAVGCFLLPRRFYQPLLDAGIPVVFDLPLWPFRKRWSWHLRNHRKIAVIDGRIGFTGSQNIGDEYRGRLQRLSPWYDSHMRVEGPAALLLQQTFAEDWFVATREALTGDEYFPQPAPAGDTIVQILPTGPEADVSALSQVMFAAVATARASIRIATPYFVPDAALREALIHAAYRGLQVKLVLPTRSDAQMVLWAARSYYAELLEAGVEIFEFDNGMLHSKILTVDDRFCMLGSANMDVRSFRLNYEITALIYDEPVARAQARQIDAHCAASRRIQARDVHNRSLRRQLIEGVARLFGPLL